MHSQSAAMQTASILGLIGAHVACMPFSTPIVNDELVIVTAACVVHFGFPSFYFHVPWLPCSRKKYSVLTAGFQVHFLVRAVNIQPYYSVD